MAEVWLKDLNERFKEGYRCLREAEAKQDINLAHQADDLLHDVFDDITIRLMQLFDKLERRS